MCTRQSKTQGQVILETVIVFICLAVIAIAAVNLFSNLNYHMLDRLRIYRQSRTRALNNPASMTNPIPVAPLSRRDRRPLSNATVFLDYLPRGVADITPDIPAGNFLGDLDIADLPSYELNLILNLILRYKINQAYYFADIANASWTGRTWYKSLYFRNAARLMDQSVELLNGPQRSVLAIVSAMINSSVTDPARAAGYRYNLTAAIDNTSQALRFVGNNLGRTVYTYALQPDGRWRWVYLPSLEHNQSMDILSQAAGREANLTGEWDTEYENQTYRFNLGDLCDWVGVDCAVYGGVIAYPFIDLPPVRYLYQIRYYLTGDVTWRDAQRASYWATQCLNHYNRLYAGRIEEFKAKFPRLYDTFSSIYEHTNNALQIWNETEHELLISAAEIEDWALLEIGKTTYWVRRGW